MFIEYSLSQKNWKKNDPTPSYNPNYPEEIYFSHELSKRFDEGKIDQKILKILELRMYNRECAEAYVSEIILRDVLCLTNNPIPYKAEIRFDGVSMFEKEIYGRLRKEVVPLLVNPKLEELRSLEKRITYPPAIFSTMF